MPVILPLVLQSVWPACLPFRPPQGLAGRPWAPGCWPPLLIPQGAFPCLPVAFVPQLSFSCTFVHSCLQSPSSAPACLTVPFDSPNCLPAVVFFLWLSPLILLFCFLSSPNLYVSSLMPSSDFLEAVSQCN